MPKSLAAFAALQHCKSRQAFAVLRRVCPKSLAACAALQHCGSEGAPKAWRLVRRGSAAAASSPSPLPGGGQWGIWLCLAVARHEGNPKARCPRCLRHLAFGGAVVQEQGFRKCPLGGRPRLTATARRRRLGARPQWPALACAFARAACEESSQCRPQLRPLLSEAAGTSRGPRQAKLAQELGLATADVALVGAPTAAARAAASRRLSGARPVVQSFARKPDRSTRRLNASARPLPSQAPFPFLRRWVRQMLGLAQRSVRRCARMRQGFERKLCQICVSPSACPRTHSEAGGRCVGARAQLRHMLEG